jgi:hypothetical protein
MDNSTILGLIGTIIGAVIGALATIVNPVIQKWVTGKSQQSNPTILLPPGVVVITKRQRAMGFGKIIAIPITLGVLGMLIGAVLPSSSDLPSVSAIRTIRGISYFLIVIMLVSLFPLFRSIQTLDINRSQKRIWIFVSALTFLLATTLSLFLVIALLKQRAVYFVIDASQGSLIIQRDIVEQIGVVSREAPQNVDIGIAVYGGGLSGQPGCNDFVELIPLSENQPDTFARINDTIGLLSSISPSGVSPVQESLEFSIQRFVGRKDQQRIVVITSGFEGGCQRLSKEKIKSIVAQLDIDTEIVIIAFGDIPENELLALQSLTDTEIIRVQGEADLRAALQNLLNVPPSLYELYKIQSP